MSLNIRAAMGEAIKLLKTADVAAATAAIQKALSLTGTLKNHALVQPPARTTAAAKAPEATGADFSARTYRSDAANLAYKLYVPAASAPRPIALVVMLHGCTQNPDDFAVGTRMNDLADELGLIVAYPHQPRSANSQGCWNWFDTRHQKRGSGEPAVLAGLASALAQEFKLDPDHVFAAGLSAGGAMADVLAATYPDVFAAVGIHSGLPYGSAGNVMSALSVMKSGQARARPAAEPGVRPVRKIIFHGGADMTVNVANGDQILEQARSASRKTRQVAPDASINGKRVTRTIVTDAQGEGLAEHWLIHGAGHAWSGGAKAGSYTDGSGPDASREMVRFFLQQGETKALPAKAKALAAAG